ncbi:hypothetical protein HFO65_22245 [Rhizobium laguerreae]|uniref:hypothetical protein n=1 Tax=Rhizobium laguerreae TaxID=1076926 RepID=UPI001C8FB8F2|nr:hypothetical protein [Rhizobium laguerreae]MBY3163341.1 hypothetical protein [Rhizobium laguerreae]
MKVAIDLNSLQTDLRKIPKYKELDKRISRFASAISFQADLESVQTSLTALSEIDANGAVDSRRALGSALMTHALTMYCRASIEDGNGRFKIGVTKDYSAEQMRKHKEVVKLRNKTFAHFDVGQGEYGTQWGREAVVFKSTDSNSNIIAIVRRSNYIARLVFDLSDLCEVALMTCKNKVQQVKAELNSLFFSMADQDQNLVQMMQNHVFRPSEFFDHPDADEWFWQGGVGMEVYAKKLVTDDDSFLLNPSVMTPFRG